MAFASGLMQGHDVLLVQETHDNGTLASVLSDWIHVPVDPYSSHLGGAAGGVCMFFRRGLVADPNAVIPHVLIIGRVFSVSVLIRSTWFLIVAVHFTHLAHQQVDIQNTIREHVNAYPNHRCIIAGDFNYVHGIGDRIAARSGVSRPPDFQASYHWHERFHDFIECAQHAHTFIAFPLDPALTSFSRLDRVYVKALPEELAYMDIQSSTIGKLMDPNRVSDHVPVSVRVSMPSHRPCHPTPIQPWITKNGKFKEILKQFCNHIRSPNPWTSLRLFKHAIHRARTEFIMYFSSDNMDNEHCQIHFCLQYLRCLVCGDGVGLSLARSRIQSKVKLDDGYQDLSCLRRRPTEVGRIRAQVGHLLENGHFRR